MTKEEISEIAREAAHATLERMMMTFGIDTSDPLSAQKQMAHLRFWTNLWEVSATRVISYAIVLVAGAILGAFIAVGLDLHL